MLDSRLHGNDDVGAGMTVGCGNDSTWGSWRVRAVRAGSGVPAEKAGLTAVWAWGGWHMLDFVCDLGRSIALCRPGGYSTVIQGGGVAA